jgi:hypothetical protein
MASGHPTVAALVPLYLSAQVWPNTLPTPTLLLPFESGVWLWCTLVMNVANLIGAHRQWDRRSGPGVPGDVWAQLSLWAKLRYTVYMARRVSAVGWLVLSRDLALFHRFCSDEVSLIDPP